MWYLSTNSPRKRTLLKEKSPLSTTLMKMDQSPDFTVHVDLWKCLHHSQRLSQSHLQATYCSSSCLFVHVMWWGLCVPVWCISFHTTYVCLSCSLGLPKTEEGQGDQPLKASVWPGQTILSFFIVVLLNFKGHRSWIGSGSIVDENSVPTILPTDLDCQSVSFWMK